MNHFLIKNAAYVATMDDASRELKDADILVADGVIKEIGVGIESDAEVIDASGFLVTPGLVNTHHHLFQTLTRAVPGAQDSLLFGWLQRLYPIWSGLTPEDMYLSAQIGLAELALSGCSTVADHMYLFPNGSRLDDTIAAAADMGMRFHPTRGSMSIGVSDGGLPPDSLVEREADILEDCLRVIDAFHDP